MDVSFDAIKDPKERERFMNMPTTFVLPAEDVDALREIGGQTAARIRGLPGAAARMGRLARAVTTGRRQPPDFDLPSERASVNLISHKQRAD